MFWKAKKSKKITNKRAGYSILGRPGGMCMARGRDREGVIRILGLGFWSWATWAWRYLAKTSIWNLARGATCGGAADRFAHSAGPCWVTQEMMTTRKLQPRKRQNQHFVVVNSGGLQGQNNGFLVFVAALSMLREPNSRTYPQSSPKPPKTQKSLKTVQKTVKIH